MRIGMPKALLYYYYGPFWVKFFEELNHEVVVSEETNKRIIDKGVKESVAEICVPVKIFVGHTLELLEQDLDYIFVPRFITIKEMQYFCPKFMGLPDLIIHGLGNVEDKILTCHISSEFDDISDYKNYLTLADKLNVTEEQISAAATVAGEHWRKFRDNNKLGYTFQEAYDKTLNNKKIEKPAKNNETLKIALLGYVNNVYDNFVNMGVIDRLRDLNVEFVTFDMLDENEISEEISDMEKQLFWTFSNKILGAGYKLLADDTVDGAIHITAFGCGPDAFLTRLLEFKAEDHAKPFMIVRVDEHTGENHLLTRIEAFTDMIRRKKFSVNV